MRNYMSLHQVDLLLFDFGGACFLWLVRSCLIVCSYYLCIAFVQIGMATAPQDPNNKKPRPRKFKGHSWSKKGSKSSRSKARELAKKPRFYAVAVGWRPGIYREWCNAAANVNGYEMNVHKSFPTLKEAEHFMRLHRLCPPGVCTPFPPAPDTPLPPDEYVYPKYDDGGPWTESDDDNHGNATFVPTIQVGPPMDPAKFAEVAAIARRIVKDTENLMLDVSECPCETCPYSRSACLMEQRFLLMRRLFQLNALLPYDF